MQRNRPRKKSTEFLLPRNHLDCLRVVFDGHCLVANAGLLLPPPSLNTWAGVNLLTATIVLGDAPGRANAGDKLMTLVASALAGGDCIDGADALRTGGTACTLGGTVKAPSTLGTFLGTFRWGHVRQLNRVSRELLARARATGAGPGDAPFPTPCLTAMPVSEPSNGQPNIPANLRQPGPRGPLAASSPPTSPWPTSAENHKVSPRQLKTDTRPSTRNRTRTIHSPAVTSSLRWIRAKALRCSNKDRRVFVPGGLVLAEGTELAACVRLGLARHQALAHEEFLGFPEGQVGLRQDQVGFRQFVHRHRLSVIPY